MFGILMISLGQWLFFVGMFGNLERLPKNLVPYLFGLLTFNSALVALLNR